MTRFVILTTQRSGSTVLTRTLDEHPHIFCAGEIFHESKANIHHAEWHFPNWKITGGKQSKLNKLVNYPNLRLNAVKHIRKFYSADDQVQAKGFKLMYSHIKSAPFIWNYIAGNNIKVIVLIRKNTFLTALSRYRMEKSGTAHSKENVLSSSLSVPAQPLLQQTLQLQVVNEKLLSLASLTDHLPVYYEEFGDWTGLMKKVDAFLNVPFANVQPVLKKVGAGDWRTAVSNYREIEDVFASNNAAQYLIQS